MRILMVLWLVVVSGVAFAEAPADVAKKIFNGQLAALAKDDDSFDKTFASGAIVNGQDTSTSLVSSTLKVETFGRGMRAPMKSTKTLSLTAGGDAKVVWFAGELEVTTVTITGQDDQGNFTSGPPGKHTVRFSELAIADGAKWKVVAAYFTEPGAPERSTTAPTTIDGATKADQLSRILISPSALSNGLAKDATAVVFGTDKTERGVGGPAAKKLVESWKPLKLEIEGGVREIRTKTYGFVQANVNWVKVGGAPYRMRGFMIATPDPTGTWTIRVVHYAAPI